MYIEGRWLDSCSGAWRNVLNPVDNSVIALAAEGDARDAQKAIAAAKRAFYEGDWAGTPPAQRADLLFRVADLISGHSQELAAAETLNSGKPLRESGYDVNDAAGCFRYYAGICAKLHGQTYGVPDPMQTMVVREPIGVCGQIVPWSYPLLMAAWKLVPALAAGNTVVFKPSELTPLTAVMLFGLLAEAGFPEGVCNLVLGPGNTVGHEIASSLDVDKVAFTGGTKTGKRRV